MNHLISILFIVLVSNTFAQKSDLENATHKTTYIGDSLEIKSTLKDLKDILPDSSEICEMTIKQIGKNTELDIQILYFEIGIGISCRGTFKTVFLQNGQYVGYFNSDLAEPVELINDNLIWNFGGRKMIMNLSNGIPEDMGLDEYERILIK